MSRRTFSLFPDGGDTARHPDRLAPGLLTAAVLCALLAGVAWLPKPAHGAATSEGKGRAQSSTAKPATSMILATTTSTYDTGLLDALVPPFESRTGIKVKVIAVGSGQALAMGKRGEADLVLSHAPEAEERFMAEGFGLLRRRMMYNDFVLVGPPADPARVRASAEVGAALSSVAASGAAFVSRGDDSGTHMMERTLWAAAALEPPAPPAYLETGQGMAATLRVGSQKRAYTLTDRGTFLAQRHTLDLEIVFEDDPALRNVYHVIVINPRNGPRVNVEGAQALARYLLTDAVLKQVAEFGRDRFGQPLFFPDPEPYGER